MKKITLSIAILALIAISNETFAQAQKSKSVSKEVSIEEENGVKTLTITNTIDGNTTTEVYTGDEAETKIAEFAKEKSGTTKTVIIGEDGKQHMSVETKVVIKEEVEEDEN
jgi:autotransporter adhesin